jgi:polysaccharide deacetylase family protein (PEP-CTERM system associated)
MSQVQLSKPVILLTIDVEDWFQVENFKPYIPFTSWSYHEFRVENNTHRLLDLLDSNNVQPTTGYKLGEKRRATFFVLGWIAERLPRLVREIHSRGHEVASHGYYHNLCRQSSYDDLKRDLSDSKKLLEDIVGDRVLGYRAPGFSINDEILKIIEDSGYLYDSSYNSFGINKRYGQPALSGNGKKGIALQLSGAFYELPISNVTLGKRTVPWGGGGYFRVTPFRLFRLGVGSLLKKEKAYLFYMHPWEIDPEQPKVNKASSFYKLRHYANLSKTHSKLSKFLEVFNHCRFITCQRYVQEMME